MIGWWLATLCSLPNQQCPPLCCHYSSAETTQATKSHQYPSKSRFISLASSLHHYKTPSLHSAPLVPSLVVTWRSISLWILPKCCTYCWFTIVLSMDKEATYIEAISVRVALHGASEKNGGSSEGSDSRLRYSLTSMEPVCAFQRINMFPIYKSML